MRLLKDVPRKSNSSQSRYYSQITAIFFASHNVLISPVVWMWGRNQVGLLSRPMGTDSRSHHKTSFIFNFFFECINTFYLNMLWHAFDEFYFELSILRNTRWYEHYSHMILLITHWFIFVYFLYYPTHRKLQLKNYLVTNFL